MFRSLLFLALAAPALAADCDMPELNHAVVLFGDGSSSSPTLKAAANTYGLAGNKQGVAVRGNAVFPSFSTSINGGSVVTGALTGTTPNMNGGATMLRGSGDFVYSLSEWIAYAARLSASGSPRVRTYTCADGKTVILRNDDADYVQPKSQSIHVVTGACEVRADNDQNNKIDGAIVAPEADVRIHRRWHHAHGFIVAKTLHETTSGNNGFAFHGQVPTGIQCPIASSTTTSNVTTTANSTSTNTTSTSKSTTTTVNVSTSASKSTASSSTEHITFPPAKGPAPPANTTTTSSNTESSVEVPKAPAKSTSNTTTTSNATSTSNNTESSVEVPKVPAKSTSNTTTTSNATSTSNNTESSVEVPKVPAAANSTTTSNATTTSNVSEPPAVVPVAPATEPPAPVPVAPETVPAARQLPVLTPLERTAERQVTLGVRMPENVEYVAGDLFDAIQSTVLKGDGDVTTVLTTLFDSAAEKPAQARGARTLERQEVEVKAQFVDEQVGLTLEEMLRRKCALDVYIQELEKQVGDANSDLHNTYKHLSGRSTTEGLVSERCAEQDDDLTGAQISAIVIGSLVFVGIVAAGVVALTRKPEAATNEPIQDTVNV
eukprot:TRINITY_DN1131_c0_g1_i4.p1 TRINITY_DN1131_c0_g1~~TRINITY_DN1131_c0_g1_i4.p1  ORF type:complete len:604 (+),score=208.56 TRINITY_DN1131_c0_g1_i4:66-1877(+)